MLNRILLILFVGLFTAAGAPSLHAQSADRAMEVRQLLEQRDHEIKELLGTQKTLTGEQREQLMAVINDGIDFAAMGRRALGSHWDELTDQQRARFVDTFSDVVRIQSLSNLDVYRAKVTYDGVEVRDDSAFVRTTTEYKDVATPVEYVMGFDGTKWRVLDIILDEVSTADSYARSFQAVVRKKGFDALMSRLDARLEKAEAKS